MRARLPITSHNTTKQLQLFFRGTQCFKVEVGLTFHVLVLRFQHGHATQQWAQIIAIKLVIRNALKVLGVGGVS